MSVSTKGRFPELLQVAVPRGTLRALDRLATRVHSTRSEVARQPIMRQLEAAGVKLVAEPDRVLA
jgi:hypothetical protein